MLTAPTQTWLKTQQYLDSALHFILVGLNPDEKALREQSVEIAVLWCRLAQEGRDGRAMQDEMREQLQEILKNDLLDTYGTVEYLWTTMCVNAAKYAFAQIDDSDFTRALYGVFRSLYDINLELRPVDALILERLVSATDADLERERAMHFAIRTQGLRSELVVVPAADMEWNKYGDQYLRILLP